jgi:putative SOS response-associated peptidase YedK
MCGRYGLKSDKQDIATAFYAKKVNPKVILAPNYNVAPSTFLPVAKLDEEGDRELTLMLEKCVYEIPLNGRYNELPWREGSISDKLLAKMPT